ncbi:hypothetical protein [Reyranella sp.]|uniref:hypothetical protein n=1 Tax=Reyranella sp. TaxID=1929291 RepID=UPI003F70F555
MNDNDDQILELTGRLSAHEFLLEVFIANWMADMRPEHIKAFADDLVSMSRRAYGPLTGDPAEIRRMQRVREAGEQAIQHLARKAERRALNIREIRSRGPSPPPTGD